MAEPEPVEGFAEYYADNLEAFHYVSETANIPIQHAILLMGINDITSEVGRLANTLDALLKVMRESHELDQRPEEGDDWRPR